MRIHFLAQNTQLLLGRRQRRRERLTDAELEAGRLSHLVELHAGVQAVDFHPPRLVVETEHGLMGVEGLAGVTPTR